MTSDRTYLYSNAVVDVPFGSGRIKISLLDELLMVAGSGRAVASGPTGMGSSTFPAPRRGAINVPSMAVLRVY
jgi:hypothetical protein